MIAMVLLVTIAVQIPFIQRVLIVKVANHFSKEYGLNVEINHIVLKPFSGTLSIREISCNSFIIDASCSEIEVSGWDLLTNSGHINSADIKGLNWDVMDNYIGVAESISLDGISIDNRTLIINQSEILGFSSTTSGNSPEILNIEKLKTGFSYNNSLTFEIDTLIGDSLNASGVLKISLENEFDADLNVSIYPEFYTDELGYDIGQIQGQIQYRDSTLLNLSLNFTYIIS